MLHIVQVDFLLFVLGTAFETIVFLSDGRLGASS
jgi:hypothetical protein